MHTLYFVRVSKDAKTIEEAISLAQRILEENNFCYGQGYFGGGRADWFVVGGRWSGEFRTFSKEQSAAMRHIEKTWPEAWKAQREFYSGLKERLADPKSEVAQAEAYFKEKTALPFYRDTFIEEGYPDDAVMITPELCAWLKKRYGKADDFGDRVQVFDAVSYEEYPVAELGGHTDAIGDWLVIIDYHC